MHSRRDKTIRKPKNIRNYVVWLLGRREWSEQELRERLTQRGCEPAEIDDAVGFAKSQGFQSDERYASMKARAGARRRGDRRLRYDLGEKGIASEMIDEQLALIAPECERAIAAVSRFERQVLDQRLKQKVWRFLSFRGFGPGAIKAAVSHLEQLLAAEPVTE